MTAHGAPFGSMGLRRFAGVLPGWAASDTATEIDQVGLCSVVHGGQMVYQRELFSRSLIATFVAVVVASQVSPAHGLGEPLPQPPTGTVVSVSASGTHSESILEPQPERYDESFTEAVSATMTPDGLVGRISGDQYRAVSYPSDEYRTACSSYTRFGFARDLSGASLSPVSEDTWALSLSNDSIGSFSSLDDAPDCEYVFWETPSPADALTVLGGEFQLRDSDPDPGRFAATTTFGPSNPAEFSRMYYTDWSITISVESTLLPTPDGQPTQGSATDQCPVRAGVQKVECRATWVTLKKSARGVKVTPNPAKAKVLINFGQVDGKGKKRFLRCSGACFVKLPPGSWWFNAQIRDTPQWLKSRAGIRPVKVGG